MKSFGGGGSCDAAENALQTAAATHSRGGKKGVGSVGSRLKVTLNVAPDDLLIARLANPTSDAAEVVRRLGLPTYTSAPELLCHVEEEGSRLCEARPKREDEDEAIGAQAAAIEQLVHQTNNLTTEINRHNDRQSEVRRPITTFFLRLPLRVVTFS